MINRSAEVAQFKDAMKAALPPFKGRKVYPSSEFEKWLFVGDKANHDYSRVSSEDLHKMLKYAEVQCDLYTGHLHKYALWRTGFESIRAELSIRG